MSPPVAVDRPSTWPAHIQARYGITRRPRWVAPVLLIVGVALSALAAAMVSQLVNPEIAAGMSNYQTLADDHMFVEFTVQRRDAAPATCVIRARAGDGFDVAYAVVEIPSGEGRTAHSYDLRTAYRPFIGELLGCSVDGPPDVAGAQFRPGVIPPEQPWTPPRAEVG